MSAVELGINVGKVDAQDVIQMVTRQLQEGKQIVFVEKNKAHHKIYISSDFLETLGGYKATNELVRTTFDTVAETDRTKTRFFFGQSFKLEDQEGSWFDVYFPDDSRRYLRETQDKFLQAAVEETKTPQS